MNIPNKSKSKIFSDKSPKNNKTYYKIKKEEARQEAIRWQNEFYYHHYSYSEVLFWNEYFRKLAKNYGLIKEFKENGII